VNVVCRRRVVSRYTHQRTSTLEPHLSVNTRDRVGDAQRHVDVGAAWIPLRARSDQRKSANARTHLDVQQHMLLRCQRINLQLVSVCAHTRANAITHHCSQRAKVTLCARNDARVVVTHSCMSSSFAVNAHQFFIAHYMYDLSHARTHPITAHHSQSSCSSPAG
jgi:hypothetical protein